MYLLLPKQRMGIFPVKHCSMSSRGERTAWKIKILFSLPTIHGLVCVYVCGVLVCVPMYV